MNKKSSHSNTNIFQRFFWFCSGADVDLLTGKYEQFPTPLKAEYNKYIGIGTAVFFTAVFATISGAFALSFLKLDWWKCLVFGMVWGANIFFLDRYIVSTMRKTGNLKQELFHALPRIFIGLLFAFTIAVPIELRLFEGKIQDELSKYNTGRIAERDQSYDAKAVDLNKQIEKLNKELAVKQKEQPVGYQELLERRINTEKNIKEIDKKLRRYYTNLVNNRSPNPKYPNSSSQQYIYNEQGKRYQRKHSEKLRELRKQEKLLLEIEEEKKEKFEKFEASLEQVEQEIEDRKVDYLQGLQRIREERPVALAEAKKVAAANTDLLSRYEALGRITEERFSPTWSASWVITLLFVFLELAPVLSKLISAQGSYDIRLESLEAEEKLNASTKNNNINERLLNIELENEKQLAFRKFSMEEEKAKLATKLFETEQEEELEKDRIRRENFQRQQEEELASYEEYKNLNKKLLEEKVNYSIATNQLLDEVEIQKHLQNKLNKYIIQKQLEHLKKEVDDSFGQE